MMNCEIGLLDGWNGLIKQTLKNMTHFTQRRMQIMTNYERIKNMSIEEMAEFICGIFDIQPDDSKFINGDLIPMYDENEIRQWLESEVSE